MANVFWSFSKSCVRNASKCHRLVRAHNCSVAAVGVRGLGFTHGSPTQVRGFKVEALSREVRKSGYFCIRGSVRIKGGNQAKFPAWGLAVCKRSCSALCVGHFFGCFVMTNAHTLE